jgi:kynurenine formamidase
VYASDPKRYVYEFPGIGVDAARWLAEQDVVLVGADTLGLEVRTREHAWDIPVHVCLLHEHGVYMLEMLDLEAIAADKIHRFLFVLAPLPITGGSGSPVNPLAIA